MPSAECLADLLSRPPIDHRDYTLHRKFFSTSTHILRPFHKCFSGYVCLPGKSATPPICLTTPSLGGLANGRLDVPPSSIFPRLREPPWTIINQWLARLRSNLHVQCLTILPFWVSAKWWPLVIRLRVPKTPAVVIPPCHGMFANCRGEDMPPPRWPLLCVLLSGSAWQKKGEA